MTTLTPEQWDAEKKRLDGQKKVYEYGMEKAQAQVNSDRCTIDGLNALIEALGPRPVAVESVTWEVGHTQYKVIKLANGKLRVTSTSSFYSHNESYVDVIAIAKAYPLASDSTLADLLTLKAGKPPKADAENNDLRQQLATERQRADDWMARFHTLDMERQRKPFRWIVINGHSSRLFMQEEEDARDFAKSYNYDKVIPLYEVPPTGFTEQDREMLNRLADSSPKTDIAQWAMKHLRLVTKP